MPKMEITAFAAEVTGQIKANAIHTICLILALSPVPFLFYYSIRLDLWDTDFQSLFSAISLTAIFCILIYISARVLAWLLYVIVVPGVVWLLYTAMYGLAWLLRTIIVPGILWLLCVALPVLARLLYAAVCGLVRWLWNMAIRSTRNGRAYMQSRSDRNLSSQQ